MSCTLTLSLKETERFDRLPHVAASLKPIIVVGDVPVLLAQELLFDDDP
jgi:hypothetical protein